MGPVCRGFGLHGSTWTPSLLSAPSRSRSSWLGVSVIGRGGGAGEDKRRIAIGFSFPQVKGYIGRKVYITVELHKYKF